MPYAISWVQFLLFPLFFIVGALLGIFITCFVVKKKLGSLKKSASKIIKDAISNANTLKKEAILESKEEILKRKAEYELEEKTIRNELSRAEFRLQQKEESLELKEIELKKELERFDNNKSELKQFETKLNDLNANILKEQKKIEEKLEQVANMTCSEAKNELISLIESEAKRDSVKFLREEEEKIREEANKKGREIIALAIQKCAVEVSSELSVSVVHLPNDEIKGRIIGREGRNIRTLENITGVDLIIDDTPEAVVLSSFDPLRREIAKISLERLLIDGRIHPARIEEIVEKVKKEIDNQIKEIGEQVLFEANIFGMNIELIKLLGKLKYRESYGQNMMKHSLEVCHLAGIMAAELGANVNIAKRGGLLHDIGKVLGQEIEGTHVSIGVELAKKYNESKEVIHCIEAHHYDVQPNTVEAILVQTADAISSARPGARRESIDNYIKRIKKLEEIAISYEGVKTAFAIQAGREIRIIVQPEEIDDTGIIFLSKEIAKRIEKEMEYPGQIRVNVIREIRNLQIAK